MAIYKVELRYWWESYELGSLVEVVNVALLFKSHFTLMVGSLCRGAPFVVNVEHFQYIEQKCSIIFVGNRWDEIAKPSTIM
jgi:hypothetical protein